MAFEKIKEIRDIVRRAKADYYKERDEAIERVKWLEGRVKMMESDIESILAILKAKNNIYERLNVGNLMNEMNVFENKMKFTTFVTKKKVYKSSLKDGEQGEKLVGGVLEELMVVRGGISIGLTIAKRHIDNGDYNKAIEICRAKKNELYELRSLLGVDYTK